MHKTMIALAGLPASGKSAVAIRLHAALDSVLLDKDQVRDFMFQHYVDYSNEQNDLVLAMMYQSAHYLLSRDQAPAVIIDGRSYSRAVQIDALKHAATTAHSNLIIIECVCSTESARQRLANDQGIHPAKDRNFNLYKKSKAAAEPIKEPRLILNTDDLTADECAERALSYIASAS